MDVARLLLKHEAGLSCEHGNCLQVENLPEEMKQLLLKAQAHKPNKKQGKKQSGRIP